jgi:hypothetical protein
VVVAAFSKQTAIYAPHIHVGDVGLGTQFCDQFHTIRVPFPMSLSMCSISPSICVRSCKWRKPFRNTYANLIMTD